MEILDVRGLSCPIPVIKTQKALEKGLTELNVIGTGNTAQQNVSKYARSKGFSIDIESQQGYEWSLILKKAP